MRLAVTPSPPVPKPPSQSPPGPSPGQSWGPVLRPSRLVFIPLASSLLLIAVWVVCWPGLKLSSALTSARTISSAFDSLSFDRLSLWSDLYSLIRRIGPTTPSLIHSLPLRAVPPITQSQATTRPEHDQDIRCYQQTSFSPRSTNKIPSRFVISAALLFALRSSVRQNCKSDRIRNPLRS